MRIMNTVAVFFFLTVVRSEFSIRNKPTFSSLPLYSNASVPGLAVDDAAYNPFLPIDQSCFVSGSSTTNGETCWFAVDLEKQLVINGVILIFTVNSAKNFTLNSTGILEGVTFGTSSFSPAVVTPRIYNYLKWGSELMKAGENIKTYSYSYLILPPSRYIIIQQNNGSTGYLTICDLWINLFEATLLSRVATSLQKLPAYKRIKVRSDLECLTKCLAIHKDWCVSMYNYGNCDFGLSYNVSQGGVVAYGRNWLTAHVWIK